jgi:rhodanese-related sulfurtransferase
MRIYRPISASVLLLLVSVLSSQAITPVEGEHFSWITLREARDLFGYSDVSFIDVNEPEIYARYHIPGAIHVTDEHLERFLPPDRKRTLVFYCAERRCSASHAAAHEAVKLGYLHVLVMPEGIFGWANAGLPTERGAAEK